MLVMVQHEWSGTLDTCEKCGIKETNARPHHKYVLLEQNGQHVICHFLRQIRAEESCRRLLYGWGYSRLQKREADSK
jgi:hypothetical protein